MLSTGDEVLLIYAPTTEKFVVSKITSKTQRNSLSRHEIEATWNKQSMLIMTSIRRRQRRVCAVSTSDLAMHASTITTWMTSDKDEPVVCRSRFCLEFANIIDDFASTAFTALAAMEV